jgi:hypothetical protein
MIVKMCVVVAALVALASSTGAADTANQCSARCERNATSDRQACADLPANPSCRLVVEKNRLRCLDFCERSYPQAPARPGPPLNGSRVDNSEVLNRISGWAPSSGKHPELLARDIAGEQ